MAQYIYALMMSFRAKTYLVVIRQWHIIFCLIMSRSQLSVMMTPRFVVYCNLPGGGGPDDLASLLGVCHVVQLHIQSMVIRI